MKWSISVFYTYLANSFCKGLSWFLGYCYEWMTKSDEWWNRSSFKNDFWPISKGEIYVVQELGLQYWDNTPMIYLTYTTENSVSLSWSFSLIWNFSRKMPKQNPFGKIGEDSPPETPTKKGNEPEPERTLLIKHDVCVYRIPPQVSISSIHSIQHRHHHDVMNMNWIFGLRTALTHEGRTAVCFRKNSTPFHRHNIVPASMLFITIIIFVMIFLPSIFI